MERFKEEQAKRFKEELEEARSASRERLAGLEKTHAERLKMATEDELARLMRRRDAVDARRAADAAANAARAAAYLAASRARDAALAALAMPPPPPPARLAVAGRVASEAVARAVADGLEGLDPDSAVRGAVEALVDSAVEAHLVVPGLAQHDTAKCRLCGAA